MPGDTVEMRNGNLIRNGKVQREPYVVHTSPGSDVSDDEFKWQLGYLLAANHPVPTPPRLPLSIATLQASPGYHPTRNNWGPLVVPRGNYFVLGDNRDNSLDSRYWGWVADSLVRGQPLVVYYSYNPDGAVKLDWITRVRWKRFGEMIQ
jgi:signal peptidase I